MSTRKNSESAATAVLYARTGPRSKVPIGDQLEAAEAWCKEKEIEVLAKFVDEEVNGLRQRAAEREGFSQMLTTLTETSIDVVVVHRYGVLSPDPEDVKAPQDFTREVTGQSIRVISVTQDEIPDFENWLDCLERQFEDWEVAHSR